MIKFDAKTQVFISEDLTETVIGIVEETKTRAVGVLVDRNVARHERVQGLFNRLTNRLRLYVKELDSQEPTTELVDETAAEFRNNTPDLLIGIGGGSTLDLAKAVSVMAVNSGRVADYHGTGKPIQAAVPKIMIPTTAGTGSEVTPGAVLVNPKTSFKRALGGRLVCPDYAVLDAHLTCSLPPEVTAATGMDALAHAIESYTAKCANPITRMYSREAFSLMFNNLPKAFVDSSNLEVRRNLQLGSCLAGFAIYNSNTGACHSMAYALGIYRGVPHGTAVGLLIPKVLEINVQKGCTLYADLFDLVEGVDKRGSRAEKATRFTDLLLTYSPLAFLRKDPNGYGIGPDSIHFLLDRSLDLTSALSNNPVEFTRKDANRVLEQLVVGLSR